MLKREFQRLFFSIVDVEKPDYIFIDFIEERHDFLDYNGVIYTKSDALLESDFPVNQGRTIARDSDEGWEIWKKACLYFIDELKKRFIADHVILVENILTEAHGDINHSELFSNVEDIRRLNNILKECYKFFKDHYLGIQIVNMTNDPLYITDDLYEYGCYPWHLNELMNIKISSKIRLKTDSL